MRSAARRPRKPANGRGAVATASALPSARVYQLWAIAGGQPISAGTFVPDAQGRYELVADVPSLLERPAALAVTVEPQGGVPSPTGPKYLLGAPAE